MNTPFVLSMSTSLLIVDFVTYNTYVCGSGVTLVVLLVHRKSTPVQSQVSAAECV